MVEYTEDDKEMLKSHDDTLRGNGEIGLKAEVQVLSDYVKGVKDWVKWTARIGVGVFILQVIDMVGK
ncbi:hypothetical protein LCGC14_1728980 [marine sediment metagenome]|uniref:Uncharacterized protein n=1 Tax=marine sediment metagenome TaxID=412755 RepID=A0A0F9H9Y2_9ZZZZ